MISADGQKLTVGTLIADDYSTKTLQRVDGTTVPPKSCYMAGVSDTPTRPEVAEATAPHWTPPARTLLERKMDRERAVTRYASYLIWLHATAPGMLLLIALMYQSSLGWPTILIQWAVAMIGGVACVFLLHALIGAGILEITVGLTMLMRALFPKSSFG